MSTRGNRFHGTPRSSIRWTAWVAGQLCLVTLACDDGSRVTGPPPLADEVACAATMVELAVMQTATVDCRGGNLVTLAGNGASYLLVPQFATSDLPNVATPFVIGYSSALAMTPAANRVAPPIGQSALILGDNQPRGTLQAKLDLGLRGYERKALAAHRWQVPAFPRGALSGQATAVVPAPPLNSERAFNILASWDPNDPVFKSVSARLDYVGDNLLVYVDTASPVSIAASDLDEIGRLFDGTLYPLDVTTFGSPVDTDGNERVIMLMSPAVNALTTASDCATQGYISGFFDGVDLADTSSTESNRGEVFYTIVPDPEGTVSCAHSMSDFLRQVPSVFLHELQHMINFSQKVVLRRSSPEEGWLDEGMSRVAEELGSIHYEALYPAPSGRTNPRQLFPDSAESYIIGVIYDSYQFLLNPAAETVTLHEDSDDGLAWRGGDWLLLRWLGDQFGTNIYQRLEQTAMTGTANVAAASGLPFQSLFGDFGLALYADSIPGQAHTAAPLRDRFSSRNLRQLYQALFNAGGPSNDIPRQFPITTFAIGVGSIHSDAMPPGSLDYATLVTPPDSAAVHLRFAKPDGGALPSSLAPQLGILRLPS